MSHTSTFPEPQGDPADPRLPTDHFGAAVGTSMPMAARDFFGRLWQLVKRIWGWLAYTIGSFFLLILLLAVIFEQALMGSLAGGSEHERIVSGDGTDKIAILPLYGVIGLASSPLADSAGISYDQIDEMLLQAERDDQVRAIILEINSPGGSAVVSEQIYQRLKRFRSATNKPVIASFGDTAASGGYYVAAMADKIVANQGTLTGSIGVILEYYTATGLMDKVGVKAEVIKSGNYKDIGSPYRETTNEERGILQSIVNDSYEQFVDRIAEGRKLDEAVVRKLADGRIYSGTQALEHKLVDALGSREQAILQAKLLGVADDATVVEYTSDSWIDQLFGGAMQSLRKSNPLSSLEQFTPNTSASLQYLWRP
jgi:protease-4